MAQHNALGKAGEKQARWFLQRKGYTLLESNWRYEKAEVDIIAREHNTLVIVEVKTRSTDYFGDPEEAVTPQKARRLIRAAEAYAETNEWNGDVRFDIIAIISKDGKTVIRHIEEAFYAADYPE